MAALLSTCEQNGKTTVVRRVDGVPAGGWPGPLLQLRESGPKIVAKSPKLYHLISQEGFLADDESVLDGVDCVAKSIDPLSRCQSHVGTSSE